VKVTSTHRRASNKSKRHGTPGGSGDKKLSIKDALIAMQIKAMQRAAEPIKEEFKIATVPDIIEMNRQLAQLTFDRKIDARTLSAVNGIVANQLKILMPSTVEVNQQVTVQPETITEDELARALRNQPVEVQEAIILALRKSRIESESVQP